MADKGEEAPLLPNAPKKRQRNVNVMSLVAITYFAVAGGPEGTETLIQTGGPLYSVIGFVVVGVLWSVPVALMSAELTTAFPENGGYVLWVSAAFGNQAGEMAGWLQFVSSGVDACIYPGLFLVYLEQALDMDLEDPTTQWTVKIGFVTAMLALNFAGIQSVGHGSTAFMIILLTPFVVIVLIAFTGVFTGTTILGWPFSTENMLGTKPAAEVDWPAFLMVMLWNMGYWEGASVCAGEVADIGRVFPQAIAITMVVVLLNYILPIMAFSGLDGDYAAFDNGHYIAVARNVCGQYFGWALGLAQTVSVCGLFAQGVLKNTYLVCGMAEQGMLPRALAARMPYTNSPYVALLATTIILVLIMPLRTFKTILGVDIDLYCLALLLEIGAFIRLRSTQPDRPREYRIPVDGVWVYLVFIPAIIITVAGVVLGGWLEFMVMIAFIAGGVVVILILHVLRDTRPEWFSLAEGVSDVMGAAAYTRVDTQEPASAP